jgi:hypothetical protein
MDPSVEDRCRADPMARREDGSYSRWGTPGSTPPAAWIGAKNDRAVHSQALSKTLARLAAAGSLAGALACRGAAPSPPLSLQIVDGADRRSSAEEVAASSVIFDGTTVRLRAARGEIVDFTVWPSMPSALTVRFSQPQLSVSGFEVEWTKVARPSTAMYGPSRGAADYPDGLRPRSAPATAPGYFEIAVSSDAGAGIYLGTLTVGSRAVPVELQVDPVLLPALGAHPSVWAYYDPRELAWHAREPVGSEQTFALEQRCAAMFRDHGVLATPELAPEEWPRRRSLVSGVRYVPVYWPRQPEQLAAAARFWSDALSASDQLAFAIPIDEPRSDAGRREVRALAEQLQAVRAATGAKRLLLAVTDAPHPIYGAALDIFISPHAVSRRTPRGPAASAARWTYNGAPPYAGAMVVDAGNADLRTWGWIAWRWQVPLWYVWDALYWHDRHNARRAGLARPGRSMEDLDAVTFDDGTDHGNRDGVLALPGDPTLPCRPTLRLKTLRRGLLDRLLLQAASCTPASHSRAEDIAAALIPFALGDAFAAASGRPLTAAQWTQARAQLLALAAQCQGQQLAR